MKQMNEPIHQSNPQMTYIKHLSELVRRLTRVLILFVVLFIGAFFFADHILQYLKNDPAASQISWHAFHLTDAIRVYMQIAFIVALGLTIPFALYQLWGFAAPGLEEKERRPILLYLPAAILLFVLGVLFAYVILFPMVVEFLSAMAVNVGAEQKIGIAQYFGFLFNLILPFGLIFELPLVVMFLTRIGIINPKTMSKMRKISYLVLVVIATFVTPPDPISDILVAIPLILLFEISLLLSRLVYRKRLKRFTSENK